MGAHVLIFGQLTFPVHLSSLVTGSGNLSVPYSQMDHRQKWELISDFSRINAGDRLYFYVQADNDIKLKTSDIRNIYNKIRSENDPEITGNTKLPYIHGIRRLLQSKADPKDALYQALDECRLTDLRLRNFNEIVGDLAGVQAGYYGVYEALSVPYIVEYSDKEPAFDIKGDQNSRFAGNTLTEHLWLRCEFKPVILFPRPVSENQLLDDRSDDVTSWTLIYRKLAGLRSCTPLPPAEEKKLVRLLFESNETYFPIFKDEQQSLAISNGQPYTAHLNNQVDINISRNSENRSTYGTPIDTFLANDIARSASGSVDLEAKLEAHLCNSIIKLNNSTSPLGLVLNDANEDIEWIGNQVICSAGNKRADVVCFQTRKDDPFSQLSSITLFELKMEALAGNEFIQAEVYAQWLAKTYLNDNLNRVKRVIMGYKDPSQPLSPHLSDLIGKLANEDVKIPCAVMTYAIVNGQIAYELHYNEETSNTSITKQVWDKIL